MLRLPREKTKTFEICFLAIFSTIILLIFYSLVSMNGLVLGNDPAVHVERAQLFLQTGRIPLANLGWTPPLYQILLAVLISFTGAASVDQIIFLVRIVAAVINWLLIFSVYLVGVRFFNRKVGITAAILLLFSFPLFELNLWGGYTSVLAISFLVLLLIYLPSAVRNLGYIIVTGIVAYSVVLSHQLAVFVALFILSPVILVMLVKSRGKYLTALVAVILGGGVAFFLYYIRAMLPYLGGIVEHLFFSQKTTLYQIPATTLNAFMVNFGFVCIAAICGVFVAYFSLGRQDKLLFLVLFLSLLVPFMLAESHVFGLYLPFQWFIYYLVPPLAVFGATFLIYAYDKFSAFYFKHCRTWGKIRLQAVAIGLTILMIALLIARFGIVYGKIQEAGVYYSTSDVKSYDAGMWIRNNFPSDVNAVATEIPGFWFQVFSGKPVIAATDPIIERNNAAESILDLSFELENPQTLVTAFAAKGDISDETSVLIDGVWNKVAYSSTAGDFINYTQNGVNRSVALSNFTRETTFDKNIPPRLITQYVNDALCITKTISFHNDSYVATVTWTFSAINNEVSNVILYTTLYLDLGFSFTRAFVPGSLIWENPWQRPSNSHGNDWVTADFSSSTLSDNYVGLYDEKNLVIFALKFEKIPDWGNVGALASHQIDAIRFNYTLGMVNSNRNESFTYQTLALSDSSNPAGQESVMKSLFEKKATGAVDIRSRSYEDYIRQNNVHFIVYDKNELDTKIVNSNVLELVYSNDRYVIFKTKGALLD